MGGITLLINILEIYIRTVAQNEFFSRYILKKQNFKYILKIIMFGIYLMIRNALLKNNMILISLNKTSLLKN